MHNYILAPLDLFPSLHDFSRLFLMRCQNRLLMYLLPDSSKLKPPVHLLSLGPLLPKKVFTGGLEKEDKDGRALNETKVSLVLNESLLTLLIFFFRKFSKIQFDIRAGVGTNFFCKMQVALAFRAFV